jgi:hypothetical protein
MGLCLIGMGLMGTALGSVASAQAVSTTTVQGTVYLANGQAGSGTLDVSWPAFTTANGQAITADRMTVTIGQDGFVSVNLAPNQGATPAGLYYTAVYHMNDGTTSTEYWVVPAAAQASVGQVRTKVMPSAQAVQAVSKAYVDQAITELTESLLTASGGTLSGPLYLNGDPTQALQAADKHYVDSTFSMEVPISGGSMTGPLTDSSGFVGPLTGNVTGNVSGSSASVTGMVQLGNGGTGASSASAALANLGGLPTAGGALMGALTGPSITATQLGGTYQVDQFSGADIGAKLQACLSTVSATYGGTCDARNFSGSLSMGSNVRISTANATILLPCATISTASQIVVTAGTRNVALRGCALRGTSVASGSQGGTVFLYSGTGAMVQVGDPTYAADTMGFHLDNVVINTTASSNATAQGLTAYRTQEMDLESLYLLGNSNQTGMTLDGTGNYTGGTFLDNAFNGFQTAVNAIGHQIANPATTDWMNASTFVRLHIDCPTSAGNPVSGTYGINLQQGDGNTFTGGDVEGCSTALHLGPNAQNNTIVGMRNENSTSQIVADAGSSYNNWITGGTMFTGQLTDNGTRNSFLDSFHRSFNGIKGDWYGSQQDATVTNHYRIGIGAGNERGLLDRYQTDYGYRWTTGLSDATAGEQFYQVLDELNNVYRLSIGQYNNGQASTNNQTAINAAGTGAVVLNGSNNSGTGGVIIGSGGASESTVATISNAGNAQFNGTLQVGGTSTFIGSTTVKNQADAEIDQILWAGATANQKESLIYKDWSGNSQWYMVKDANNNWAVNSATGGLDSFKAYQNGNSGDTYINTSNSSGVVRLNYESGSSGKTYIYGGNSSSLIAAFSGTTAISFPGLAASSGRNCLQIDNSGYISNTGSACGTGSGGTNGTVNSGNAGQVAYYAANGTAISGTSAVPVASGGTGAVTGAAALANLGGQAAVPGLSGDGQATPGIQVPGMIAAQTEVTAQSPFVDVRAYGAKCNGTSDDTAAIAAAAAACSVSGGTLYIPGAASWGFYSTPNTGAACLTSAQVTLPTNCNMQVDGALRATANMSAVVSTGSSGDAAQGRAIYGHGLIDPNGLAQRGIFLRSFAHYKVQDISIGAATLDGIDAGDPSITSGTAGGEAMIDGVQIMLPTSVAKTAGSIGINIDNSADAQILNSTIVGYDHGISTNAGGLFVMNHCWGGPSAIPTECYLNNGSGGLWINDVADTVTTYGYHFKGYSDQVIGGFVESNSVYSSYSFIGIQFDVSSPNATVTGVNFWGGSGSAFISSAIGGSPNLSALTLMGNGCNASVTNCNALGVSAAGPLVVNTTAPSNVNQEVFFHDSNNAHVSDYFNCMADGGSGTSAPSYSSSTGLVTFYSDGTNNGGSLACTNGVGSVYTVTIPDSGAPTAAQTYSMANVQNRTSTTGTWNFLNNIAVYGNIANGNGTLIPSTASGYTGTGGIVLSASPSLTGSVNDTDTVSTAYSAPFSGVAPNLGVWGAGRMFVGQAKSNYSQAAFGWYGEGTLGASSNRACMGLYGAEALLCVSGTGDVNNPNGTLIPGTAAGYLGSSAGKVQLAQSATTGSIGGSALAAGQCASGTATIASSATGHTAIAATSDGVNVQTSGGGLYTPPQATVSGTTATVEICAIVAGTPTAKTYNVTVF